MNIYFENTGSSQHPYIGSDNENLIFGTSNAEKARIDSSGRVLIGTTDVGGGNADDLTVATSGNTGITIRSGTSNTGNIFWSDATSGADQYVGAIEYHHDSDVFKFNISNTTRMQVDSTGDVTISDGDLVIGTSGHGIDFSATGDGSGASSVSELLDDYEEGFFTPTWSQGVSSPNYTNQHGGYVKVGRMVETHNMGWQRNGKEGGKGKRNAPSYRYRFCFLVVKRIRRPEK